MAGLRGVTVGDFALNEDVGEIASEEVADRAGQLGDREDAAFGAKVELKLAHGDVARGPWAVARECRVAGFSYVWQGKELAEKGSVNAERKGLTRGTMTDWRRARWWLAPLPPGLFA